MMKLIDFHAHVIPWADHGSSSLHTSQFQLLQAQKRGISKVVATPHFYPQYENAEKFIKRRNECFERLKEDLNGDFPEVRLGAEVLICDNIESMPGLETLCIEGTRVLLLELPFTDFSDSYVYSVKMLLKQGYKVILAHADRYDPDNIDRLISAGAMVQLNADSLSRLLVQPHVRRWIEKRKVVALGSDIHGPDNKAYKRFERAVKKLGAHAAYVFESSNELLS